jgi:hypothetical protein
LDGCNIDANLEFLISRVFARGRLDEVRDIECPRGPMAQIYELIIARVKDDDGRVDS